MNKKTKQSLLHYIFLLFICGALMLIFNVHVEKGF